MSQKLMLDIPIIRVSYTSICKIDVTYLPIGTIADKIRVSSRLHTHISKARGDEKNSLTL